MLSRLETVPAPLPRYLRKFLHRSDKAYVHFWRRRDSNRLVGLLFVAEAVIFLLLVLGGIANNIDSVKNFLQGQSDYGHGLIFGQLAASIIVAGYAINGALKLHRSRAEAFEQFRRATLVNIFLTEFFIFSRIQFGAIPSFTLNLVLLLALRYAIHHELHYTLRSTT